jgi:hypothetical protein
MVKTSYRLAQEALVYNITNIILYISCASSYRRDFLRLVLFCYSEDHWNNRIGPMTEEQLEMNTASTIRQLYHDQPMKLNKEPFFEIQTSD